MTANDCICSLVIVILREKLEAAAGKSCARSSQTESAEAAFCY